MTAVNYPHGLVDPIESLNNYLLRHSSKVWIHVDSCLGGYITSISSKLGDKRFEKTDFRLAKVGTISVDPHKYAQAPKGCSVLLFRTRKLKACSIYANSDWNGG